MIAHAPDWLQPLLWIACIALAGSAIVLVWSKVSTRVERLDVESMSERYFRWKHSVLIATLLLLALVIMIVVGQIA